MSITREVGMTFIDKANKPSSTSVNASQAQAGAYNTTPGAGDIFDWFAAMAELSLGNVQRQAAGPVETNLTTPPTDDNAYRSAKLNVFFHDATIDRKGRFQVPARDASKFNTSPGSKNVILTVADGGTAEIEALVSATQKLYSPFGNLMIVDSIVIAGGKQ